MSFFKRISLSLFSLSLSPELVSRMWSQLKANLSSKETVRKTRRKKRESEFPPSFVICVVLILLEEMSYFHRQINPCENLTFYELVQSDWVGF